MTTYVSAVPLAMVRTTDGSYRNVFLDEPIEGESVQPENLERMLRKGFLVEAPDVDEPDTASVKPPTVEEILAEVGEDKVKAQAALDQESAAKRPRKTLVDPLQAILAAE